ncbi:MAG TPA: YezD family protein [Opitutaceae bacterium]|nr:YezD family protein [Opitutaceae bacterium]
MTSLNEAKPTSALIPEWLEIVRQKVDSLRYGVVQIVVHDARVTQIERTEKTRLPGSKESSE